MLLGPVVRLVGIVGVVSPTSEARANAWAKVVEAGGACTAEFCAVFSGMAGGTLTGAGVNIGGTT